MNELFAKSPSTKTLSYIWHFDLDYPIEYLKTITKKYDIEYRITTPHPVYNPIRNRHGEFITSTHISITFTQKQKNDFMLYAAIHELGILSSNFTGYSKSNKRNRIRMAEIKKTLPFYNTKTKQIEQPTIERAYWPLTPEQHAQAYGK